MNLTKQQKTILIEANALLGDLYRNFYIPLRFDSSEEPDEYERKEKRESELENERIKIAFDKFISQMEVEE